jgi:hypothetical protein
LTWIHWPVRSQLVELGSVVPTREERGERAEIAADRLHPTMCCGLTIFALIQVDDGLVVRGIGYSPRAMLLQEGVCGQDPIHTDEMAQSRALKTRGQWRIRRAELDQWIDAQSRGDGGDRGE